MARFSKGPMGGQKSCHLISFYTGLGKNAFIRPPSSEEETSPPSPKLVKDKKRKRISTSKDPKPKKNPARKPKKDIVTLPAKVVQWLREEEEENEDDGSELVAQMKRNTEAPKAAESMRLEEIPPQTEGVLEEDPGRVPELSETEDASRQNEQSAEAHGISSGVMANTSISQVQQKSERIEQFREEDNMMKVETLGWKQNMDHLASEKEVAGAQLSSSESQLQGMKEKSSAQIAELAKYQSRRETLEEIHARGFNLTNEIRKAKELEDDAKALSSFDDDDDDAGSNSGEDPKGEEAAPENG
ncbi:uncharacterized protein [Nicotiana sylvestris]|uniref:uncharacterized protein n=1 Tax=Nicotiana sylvestris TaxID=4096 RepID=UPI00388CE200